MTATGSVTPATYDPTMSDLQVDLIRSKRRRRTAQAYMSEGRLKIMVPFGLAPDEEARLVESLVARVSRKVSSTAVDLVQRTRDLARTYGLSEPSSIEWSDRQNDEMGLLHARGGKHPGLEPPRLHAGLGSRLGARP